MTKLDPTPEAVVVTRPLPAGDAGATDRRPSRADLVALVALLALLAFLWGRGRHVWYWLDEGISVGISSHRLADIPQLLRQDGSPPLYYVVLHLWMRLFGSSEASTHILSLVFALATVPAALWAGWSVFGRRAGWVAVALTALSPFLAGYVNETRMYTLVVLLGVLATATFLHAFVLGHRRHAAGFAVLLALLLYTHNWGLFFALGAGVALLVCLVLAPTTDRRRLLVDGVLAFGAAAVLYAPWVPSLLYQVTHTGAPFTQRPTLLRVREDLTLMLGGPEVVVALGLGSGLAFMALFQRPWQRRAIAVLTTVVIAMVAVGAAWALSRHNAVWVYRYLAVVVGPLLLALAVGIADGGRPAVVGLAVSALLVAPIGVKRLPSEKSNVKEVAGKLGPALRPGDLVIADFGRIPVLAHYLPPGLRYVETTGPVPDERASDQRDGTRRLEQGRPEVTVLPSLDAVPPGGRVLVVCSAGEPAPDATPFLRLIVERCDQARDLVRADDRFRPEAALGPEVGANSPVSAFLFSKVSPGGLS